MSSVSRLLALVALAGCAAADAAPRLPLRVCADPNNLPFSNQEGRGFENALAELLAKELRRPVEYTWQPQRRGFIRSTLKAGRCDVVLGVPSGFELVASTRPYYRSSYAFVTRAGELASLASLDDERLRGLRIGVHAIGDDYASVPPALALARRGLVDRIAGYSIYGDYSRPNPPADLIRAVARNEIDVAIAWGPLAGYFAKELGLRVTPVASEEPGMAFAIAIGVRRGDDALRGALDRALARRRAAITRLLHRYGVPQLPLEEDRS